MGRFSLRDTVGVLVAALFGLSCLMPLHFLPWMSWHGELLTFVSVLVLSWYGLHSEFKKNRRLRVSLPNPALPFIALAVLAVIQGATGLITFRGDVLVFGLYVALCVACLTLGFAVGSRSSPAYGTAWDAELQLPALTLLAFTLVIVAFVSALVAFAQVLELWELSPWINRMPQLRRPGANLGQPNHLATLVLMGIASLSFLYESQKLKAVSSVLIFAVLGAALAITESRTGVLSFLLLCAWWFAKNNRARFRLSPWAVIMGLVGVLSFFWMWPTLYALILQSSGMLSEVNTKIGSRLLVWPQLLQAVADRPWLGWGIREVSKAQNSVAHLYAESEPFSYSHNILLDLALGIGVPGAAVFVCGTGVWLWRHVKLANQLLSWYCLALALPLAVHSLLEFPFAYAYFLAPTLFALGALEGLTRARSLVTIGVRVAGGVLLCVSVAATWSAIEYFSIEEDFRVARLEALRIGQTPASYERPRVVVLTQLGALLDGARIAPKPGMSAEVIELAKNVAMKYPWTATQNRYALSLALNGNGEEAIRQLSVMRAMHGEKTYAEIKANWVALAQERFPQLKGIALP
jgi:O-antigen ligase